LFQLEKSCFSLFFKQRVVILKICKKFLRLYYKITKILIYLKKHVIAILRISIRDLMKKLPLQKVNTSAGNEEPYIRENILNYTKGYLEYVYNIEVLIFNLRTMVYFWIKYFLSSLFLSSQFLIPKKQLLRHKIKHYAIARKKTYRYRQTFNSTNKKNHTCLAIFLYHQKNDFFLNCNVTRIYAKAHAKVFLSDKYFKKRTYLKNNINKNTLNVDTRQKIKIIRAFKSKKIYTSNSKKNKIKSKRKDSIANRYIFMGTDAGNASKSIYSTISTGDVKQNKRTQYLVHNNTGYETII